MIKELTDKQRRKHCDVCFMFKKAHPHVGRRATWWDAAHILDHAFVPGKPVKKIIQHKEVGWPNHGNIALCAEDPEDGKKRFLTPNVQFVNCKLCLKILKLQTKLAKKKKTHFVFEKTRQPLCLDIIVQANYLLVTTSDPDAITCVECKHRYRVEIKRRAKQARIDRKRTRLANKAAEKRRIEERKNGRVFKVRRTRRKK